LTIGSGRRPGCEYQGNLAQAIEAYGDGVKRGFAESYLNLLILHEKQGRPEEAREVYERCLKEGNAEACDKMASLMRRRGRMNEVVECYLRAGELDPDSARWPNQAGLVLHEQGRFAEAEPHYREAVRREPQFWPANLNLGMHLNARGEFAESLQHLRTAANLEPENDHSQIIFLVNCLRKGQLTFGIETLRSRLERESREWIHYRNLLGLLWYTEDLEGYRQICQRLAGPLRGDGVSNLSVLEAYLQHPQIKGPPDLLARAEREAAGGHPLAKLMLGIAFYRRQEYHKALPILKSVSADSLPYHNRFQSRLYLGLTQLRLGGREEARSIIENSRKSYNSSTAKLTYREMWSRQPWGELSMLWREVAQVLQEEGLDEPVPELMPSYSESEIPAAGSLKQGDLEFAGSVVRPEMGKVVSVEVSRDGRCAYSAAFDTGSVRSFFTSGIPRTAN